MKEKVVISQIKGGLGNQFFQFATGLAIAIRNEAKFKLDLEFYKQRKHLSDFKLNYFNLDYEEAKISEINELKNECNSSSIILKAYRRLGIHNRYNKRTHLKDSIAFKPSKIVLNAKTPCYIEGWCVKEVYFKNIRDLLIDKIKPKTQLSDYAINIMDEIKGCNSISIHFRRGDYANNEVFRNIPFNYYFEGMELIMKKVEDPIFYVFSDDIRWVRQNLKTKHKIIYVDLDSIPGYNGNRDIEDFLLMKNCKHNIIANSSYSYWAAYLNANEDAIIIAPQEWFDDITYQKSLFQYSFMPSKWIKL